MIYEFLQVVSEPCYTIYVLRSNHVFNLFFLFKNSYGETLDPHTKFRA